MFKRVLEAIIREGQLIVRCPGGQTYGVNGAREADAPLVLKVRDTKTQTSIARNPALAVGEAYMDGGLVIERGTVFDLLMLAARNERHLRKHSRLRRWRGPPSNPRRRAATRNVVRHYNLSGSLYRMFLDADRQYSCAYFAHSGVELEQAQAAKKRHLAAKLLLQPGHKVLDIGSGWGGLAISLAEDYGADVTGVTLSAEQLTESRARAAGRGMERRVRFELCDYRDVKGRFDRIVSVGMFEHVGSANYQRFFDLIAERLDDKGIAVLHTIGAFDGVPGSNQWIEKYIFPGGSIPTLSQIIPSIERAGLLLTDVEVLRLHYAETIRAWRERFAAHRDEVRAIYDERFCRMWEFYLAGAEAGFREGSLVVFQLQMAKDRTVVPLTRDYITDFDRLDTTVHSIAAE